MSKTPPEVTLFIATGCAHCPSVLQALNDLLKQGAIGRLEATNIAVHPEAAQEHGIRSVPWLRIGPFQLQGSYTPAELRKWVQRAGSEQGLRDYLAELIEKQRLDEAIALARKDEGILKLAIHMLGDMKTPIGVRIGIGALLEDLAEHGHFELAQQELRKLLSAPEAQVRADAAYYLGLSPDSRTREWIGPLLEDPSPEVREIAREALEEADPS